MQPEIEWIYRGVWTIVGLLLFVVVLGGAAKWTIEIAADVRTAWRKFRERPEPDQEDPKDA